MVKTRVTRTYAAIHFEDLDPHRFEDLVRELIYDFRDWQTIEATGRGGSDDGFDIRAYDRNATSNRVEERDEDDVAGLGPMDGNQWMIQVKREKALAAAAIRKILQDVDASKPPYGYVLAAPATFSKAAYDAFRADLQSRGVMEFYLWGKPELEDMLHFPKNDRLLFTYFGISLSSRRRSRTTDIRAGVLVKNRLFKILGAPPGEFHEEVLLRDLKDDHYPYRTEYQDFEANPRWIKRIAYAHHPLGLWVHSREYYAYVNWDTHEWDYTKAIDLSELHSLDFDDRQQLNETNGRVRDVWMHLPRSRQANFCIEELVRYEDVALVDAEGDAAFKCPHIFVDFIGERGPYRGEWPLFKQKERSQGWSEEWKRIEIFPKTFAEKPKSQRPRTDLSISLDEQTLKNVREYKSDDKTLYADDDRYDLLKPRDVIRVNDAAEERFLEVMQIERTTLSAYLRHHQNQWNEKQIARRQIGRDVGEDEEIVIVETEHVFRHSWDDQAEPQEGPFYQSK